MKGNSKRGWWNPQQELTAYCPDICCGLTAPPPSVVGLPGVNTYVKWVGKVCIVDALLFLIWLQKIWSSAFRTNRLQCRNGVNVFIEAQYRIDKSFEHRSNQMILEQKRFYKRVDGLIPWRCWQIFKPIFEHLEGIKNIRYSLSHNININSRLDLKE